MSEFLNRLLSSSSLLVRQQHEIAEWFGFETRNKYAIEDEQGSRIAFAAEQQKGVLGFLFRQILGHWRSFDIQAFGPDRQPLFRAVHPFRWIFQRLEVYDPQGAFLGAIQQRFALLTKSFDVEDAQGQVVLQVRSGLFSIWTFIFELAGTERARIEKKWSGLLLEGFTDKDKFKVAFTDTDLPAEQRLLVLASSLFIDLQYFETKARR